MCSGGPSWSTSRCSSSTGCTCKGSDTPGSKRRKREGTWQWTKWSDNSSLWSVVDNNFDSSRYQRPFSPSLACLNVPPSRWRESVSYQSWTASSPSRSWWCWTCTAGSPPCSTPRNRTTGVWSHCSRPASRSGRTLSGLSARKRIGKRRCGFATENQRNYRFLVNQPLMDHCSCFKLTITSIFIFVVRKITWPLAVFLTQFTDLV